MIWAMCMLLTIVIMTIVTGHDKDDYLSVLMVLSTGIVAMIYTATLPVWAVIVPIAIIAFMIVRGD